MGLIWRSAGGSDLEFTCVCSEWASLCDLLGDTGVMLEREGQGRSLRSVCMAVGVGLQVWGHVAPELLPLVGGFLCHWGDPGGTQEGPHGRDQGIWWVGSARTDVVGSITQFPDEETGSERLRGSLQLVMDKGRTHTQVRGLLSLGGPQASVCETHRDGHRWAARWGWLG